MCPVPVRLFLVFIFCDQVVTDKWGSSDIPHLSFSNDAKAQGLGVMLFSDHPSANIGRLNRSQLNDEDITTKQNKLIKILNHIIYVFGKV